VALMEAAEESGGEGYFASVSDMMVGILFIFLLLLTVFAMNFREAEQEQKVKLAELIEAQKRATEAEGRARDSELVAQREAALAAVSKAENARFRSLLFDAVAQLEKDIKDREAARGQLLISLQRSLSDKGVTVSIDPASGILRLPEDLLFKTGDAAIGKESVARLQTLAKVLASTLPCYVHGSDTSGCAKVVAPILETVLVEGHTDLQAYRNTVAPVASPAPTSGSGLLFARPVAPQPKVVVVNDSELRNDRLSTDRALNVFKELKLAQPSLDTLRNSDQQSLLGFSGYGPRRPLPDALGSSQVDFQKNRRIDLRFVLSSRTSDELMRLREQIQKALGNNQ
jgi:flagellar motor protein MotB